MKTQPALQLCGRDFYDELGRNIPVAEALRRAQIKAIRSDSSQAPVWASIVLYSR